MKIRLLSKQEKLPMELLLEADPSEQMIQAYTKDGLTFVAEAAGMTIGVFVLFPLSDKAVEIKNIAVAEPERGKGIAKKLIACALKEAKDRGFGSVEIGTGNSSIGQLALYQKCGFRLQSIDRDFFIRNYPELIFENGIQCRDMVRLVFEL